MLAMTEIRNEIINSKKYTPLSVARLGATTIDIIPQWQKCHNKPFSLNYPRAIRKRVSRAVTDRRVYP